MFLRRNKKSINTFLHEKGVLSENIIMPRVSQFCFVAGLVLFTHYFVFSGLSTTSWSFRSYFFSFLFLSFFFSFVVIIVVISVVVTISIGFVDQINYSYTLLQQCFN